MNPPADPLSIEDLLRQREWIRGLARAMVGGDPALAADVEQEAWLTALRRPPRPGPGIRTWFRRVLRSRVIDRHRAHDRRNTHEAAAPPAEATVPTDDLVEMAEIQGAVARAVAELPEPYRITVLLRYFRGLEAREIARESEVPLATVRTRLHRAHGMLRERLEVACDGVPSRRLRGLMLLAADPASPSGPTASNILKGGLAVTGVQKAAAVIAIVVLAIGGGMLGAWVFPPADGEEEEHEPLAPTASSTPRAPVLGGVDSEGSASSPDLSSLRQEIRDLRAALGTAVARLEQVEEERLSRLERLVPAVAAYISDQNQTAAHAVARNCRSAQAQMQATARVDVDRDGTGEYGGFLEMSGEVSGRMDRPLVPPVLSGAFRRLTEAGEAERQGYLYRIYLPDRQGAGVGEPQGGFSREDTVDTQLAETTWCFYAWPVEYGVTGRQTFFVSQSGDVFATDDPHYSGSGNGPAPDAAFDGPGITGTPAHDQPGQDGNHWRQVG